MFRSVALALAFALAPACTPATMQGLEVLAEIAAATDGDDCHDHHESSGDPAVDGFVAIVGLGIAAVELVDAAQQYEAAKEAARQPAPSPAGPGNAVGRDIAGVSQALP